MVDPQDCERVSDVTDMDACVDEESGVHGKVARHAEGGLAGLQTCLSLCRVSSLVAPCAAERDRRRGGGVAR